MEAYTDALLREMAFYEKPLKDYAVDTVFFGGGTPSLLPVPLMEKLLLGIREHFTLLPHAEITGEANPATGDPGFLAAWRKMGFTRLSMGVQSFQNEELKALGRLHTAEEAKDFFKEARAAGFSNISMDLMYAIPSQTPKSFESTLREAIALSPEHLSAYSLKIEEGTPFFSKKDTLIRADEETEVAMYDRCHQLLEEAGYTQYEVSNYAKEGKECRHNLHYWRDEEYVGLGVSAYSYFGGCRYGWDRDFAGYLKREFHEMPPGEFVSQDGEEYETVMLGLRLKEGIDERAFQKRFGYGFREKYGDKFAPYLHHGLMEYRGDTTRLTHRGMYVMNAILSDILS